MRDAQRTDEDEEATDERVQSVVRRAEGLSTQLGSTIAELIEILNVESLDAPTGDTITKKAPRRRGR